MKLWKICLVMIISLLFTLPADQAQAGVVRLNWDNAEDAVRYELEITNTLVAGDNEAKDDVLVYRTTNVYTPGIEFDLSLLGGIAPENLYYRVRPLNFLQQPVAPFSEARPLLSGVRDPQRPQVTALYDADRPVPLYPTYSWIPVAGATHYQVEVIGRAAGIEGRMMPMAHKLYTYNVDSGYDCYDWHPYVEPGTYYWRVRAFDAADRPLGNYSEMVMFKVVTNGIKWASFGDSITHGGGAISNPPTDIRYDYTHYLPFTVKNLGRSGDTAENLVLRFDHDVLPFHPQYLLILGGTNSIRGGVPAAVVIDSLTKIRDKCLANGITPIFLTVPPLNPERINAVFHEDTADTWNDELAVVNAFLRTQKYVVDIYPQLADENGILPVKYSEDGLHPGIAGKKVIAGCVRAFLQQHNLQ